MFQQAASYAQDKAKATNQVIRAVIAHTENPIEVEAGQDPSKFKPRFPIREISNGSH